MIVITTTMQEEKIKTAFSWLAQNHFKLYENFSHNLKEIRDQAALGEFSPNAKFDKRIEYACHQAYELDKLYYAQFGEHFGRMFNKTDRQDMIAYLGELNQLLSWN